MKLRLLSALVIFAMSTVAQTTNNLVASAISEANEGKEVVKVFVSARDYVGQNHQVPKRAGLFLAGAATGVTLVGAFVFWGMLVEDLNCPTDMPSKSFKPERANAAIEKAKTKCEKELLKMIEVGQASLSTHYCSDVYFVGTNRKKGEKRTKDKDGNRPTQICEQSQMQMRQGAQTRMSYQKAIGTYEPNYILYSSAILKY